MGLGRILAHSAAAVSIAALIGCSTTQTYPGVSNPSVNVDVTPGHAMSREDFERATGAKLYGSPEGIELSGDATPAKVAEALLLHQRLATVDEVYIHSPEDKIACSHDIEDWLGLYCTSNGAERIVVKAGQPAYVSEHEVFHNEERAAFTRNDGLRERLEALASVNGESLYFTEKEQEHYRDREFDKMPAEKLDSVTNFELGFANTHGRLNVREDAAVFLTAANRYDRRFAKAVTGGVRPLHERARLWMEAGVLPQDYLEYKLLESMEGSEKPTPESDPDSLQAYERASTAFLEANPDSEYLPRIHLQRGLIAQALRTDAAAAATHFIIGVHAAHSLQRVEYGIYNELLLNAANALNEMHSDYARRMFYAAAAQYELRRLSEPDIALHGVRDFLHEKDLLGCDAQTLLLHDKTKEWICSARTIARNE